MKSSNRSFPRYLLILAVGGLTFLGLVSWSPPTNEDVLVSSGNVLIRDGIIDVRNGTGTANTFGTVPAVIVGTANNLVRGTGNTQLGRGLVIGASNIVSTAGTFSAVVGTSNDAWVSNSLVVGNLNSVSSAAPDWNNSTRYSVISGYQNFINTDCESLLVGGKLNTVKAYSSLVSGNGNTIGGPAATPGSLTYHSAAIGQNNLIAATYGWTMGYSNIVSGSRAVALGSGLTASNTQSAALGRFNADMQSNDVLVIGTGTDANTKNTALRVTSDGGVILGRAQGDISMGIYAN